MDDDALTDLQVALREQRVVRGGEHLREATGLGPRDAVGHGQRDAFVHHDPFGLGAAAHDRHDPVAGTEADAVDPGGEDLAGELHTRDVLGESGRRRIQAPALQHVGPVQACGVHRDEQLLVAGRRVGVFPPLEGAIDDGDGVHEGPA